MSDAIREEITKNSKLGAACNLSDELELLPTELVIAILIKAILSHKGKVTIFVYYSFCRIS